MEVLKFKLSGKTAFFKKPEVNTYGYFTYGNIHKVALLGILGAILGYKGYSQFSDLAADRKKKRNLKLEISYPDFYEQLKDLNIAIAPYRGTGAMPKKMQLFNNSVGYASKEQGRNLIVKQQWLENPAWHIYILLDCEQAYSIKKALMNKTCKYYPYLGSNDHFANITEIEILQSTIIERDKYRLNSFILKDNISWLNIRPYKLSADERKIYANFKYEESLPYLLDGYTNNYILKKFVYTGLYIEVHNTPVYCLENKQCVVFY